MQIMDNSSQSRYEEGAIKDRTYYPDAKRSKDKLAKDNAQKTVQIMIY